MTPMSDPLLPSGLPALDADARHHGERVARYLAERIQASPSKAITFEEWMDLALYAPGLGYYVSGNTKFGGSLPSGDFATAPELTPIFGQIVARQAIQIIQACQHAQILEFGAGSGALAASILDALEHAGLRVPYHILELSPELQARQRQALQRFGDQVSWLTTLPEQFRGCVVANEVLDAMPVTVFRYDEAGHIDEAYVARDDTGFVWQYADAQPRMADIITSRVPPYPGYQSEINLRAEAWVRQMGSWLTQGAALLIDYGFPRREYYHPQRAEGTLMCHFRHHAHAQPLVLPGLQDITAHVDFTAMADAALAGGLNVLGYTSQAHFLLNAGLPDVVAAHTNQPRTLSAVQTLMSEAEMGELFKVMAVGTDLDITYPLLGFTHGDRRDRL